MFTRRPPSIHKLTPGASNYRAFKPKSNLTERLKENLNRVQTDLLQTARFGLVHIGLTIFLCTPK